MICINDALWRNKTRNLLGSLTGKKVVLLGELEKETGTAWSGYSAIVVFVPEWSKQTTFKFNDNFTSSNDTNKGKQYVFFCFYVIFIYIVACNATSLILHTKMMVGNI